MLLLEKDFEKLSPSKKIFYNSPVNLSSEQQKILMALNRKDTKTLIVEGPPGTGKSHTIVSIIANYILNNKSVLVLSDKNEALDFWKSKNLDFSNLFASNIGEESNRPGIARRRSKRIALPLQ